MLPFPAASAKVHSSHGTQFAFAQAINPREVQNALTLSDAARQLGPTASRQPRDVLPSMARSVGSSKGIIPIS
eukprot:CAMPEP_0197597412 /NCGR_PEP_ID=MMETSP1326-20131121/27288_1 /TAXON_ID=1155430 /ORGANISM="Genus nov. species nov., Strain RCC2288" /LENGTH=72 /DNA_ID=CAMNT_0043164085 /DNA_START=509 /DNA_END=724 /DNA_ORIENTATION=+